MHQDQALSPDLLHGLRRGRKGGIFTRKDSPHVIPHGLQGYLSLYGLLKGSLAEFSYHRQVRKTNDLWPHTLLFNLPEADLSQALAVTKPMST